MGRIVIDAREWSSTTGRYSRNLVKYLGEIDTANNYFVLLKTADKNKSGLVTKNQNIKEVEADTKEFTVAEQTQFLNKVGGLHADLVHFCMIQQPILYRGKTVTTFHDLTTARFRNPAKNFLVFSFKQQVYKLVIRVVAKKSKAIIVPSNYVKDDLVGYTHISPNKVHVTYESADKISDNPKSVQSLVDASFIMYTGRPLPHKNLKRLIDSFAIIQKTYPNLKLVLSGKTDVLYESHKQYVQEQQLSNVVFTDFVSEGQLRWLYEHCEAYIFPSLSEGFGLPGLEAMTHGAPVVSSNATCLPEVYEDAAYYFNPNDTDDMAAKITDVLDSKKLRDELIKKGFDQIKKYSWKRMAEQTLAIYQSVLKD